MLSRIVRIALPAALAITMIAAATASAATLRGVVVHRNHHAHSFVIALSGGRMVAVHARHGPRVGRRVVVKASKLRNGTYAAKRVRVLSRVRHARIRGVVTFADSRRGLFTVSSRGASILVHRSPHVAGTAPSVGDDVVDKVGIDQQGELQDEGGEVTGTQTENVDLEGTILAIDTTARVLTVSADDDESSGASLTVHVPTTVDISTFAIGEQVDLRVTKQTDGTFLLQSIEGDGGSGGCVRDAGDGSGGSGCTGESGSGGSRHD